MPVRLTSRGPFLLTYDGSTKKWITIEGIDLCVLAHKVDVEPGTTIGRVFDMVESHAGLKQFLGEYCGVDISKLHEKPRTGGQQIRVFTGTLEDLNNPVAPMKEAVADAIEINRMHWVYTDEHTGDRCFEGGTILYAKSFENWENGTSVGDKWEESLGFICGLELRLNTALQIVECDDDLRDDDSNKETFAFEAVSKFTLFEALTAIYEMFGSPAYDDRFQRQVDEDEELQRRFREYLDDTNEDG